MPDATTGRGTGERYRRFLARLRRVRSQGVALGLERVRLALQRLGAPERRLPAVHIAGTNGKGSVAAMVEAILRRSGARTGLFTSPHLVRFTERIRIDGVEVDGDHLATLDEAVAGTLVPLTYFEVATVLALLAFAEAGVEVAILETGLGGRLDATSVCRPLACAITSIALDHEAILGDTLAQIAFEKAGIAKPGVPLFLGPLPAEAAARIVEVASTVGAPLCCAGVDYPPAIGAPALAGAHQLVNAALAVALSRAAARTCGRTLGEAQVLAGLAGVCWPGRLEQIAPDVLLDCAHNVEGARALAAALPEAPRRLLVTSVVRDKNAAAMLDALAPHFDLVIATRSPSERAMEAERLAGLVPRTRAGDRQVASREDPFAALVEARHEAARVAGGQVVVAGSIFLVGALRAFVLGEPLEAAEASDPAP
ncbi:MAG: bifunctional folylpolyglutamate synthase/dihydrofolate synthase [Deltaproteobacteria bacterium]|nr:bifunctional folylpolyglutamate synthase/dihydrofolate synthase [Deltaproteobacteria bacterium]